MIKDIVPDVKSQTFFHYFVTSLFIEKAILYSSLWGLMQSVCVCFYKDLHALEQF